MGNAIVLAVTLQYLKEYGENSPTAVVNDAWETLNYNNLPQPLDALAINKIESLYKG